MKYESLLLKYGGGIVSEGFLADQHTGSVSLVIGIGGVGVAALSKLKGKIHQKLKPDLPGAPYGGYCGIQLLGIDSDETDYKRYKGNCRLTEDEFLSLCNPSLAPVLCEKDAVKSNSYLNWMDIDKIEAVPFSDGAGGIRQIGRYLLMNRIGELEAAIENKVRPAMHLRETTLLDVYIFAGLGGGTGSGCYADVCYILRSLAENQGWNIKITGYFFLPDVVISKHAAGLNGNVIAYSESNGYAALKELDYLMNLSSSGDRFVQDYNASIRVDTQSPPVDMCHLISATCADGTMRTDGFDYAIDTASDHVLNFLSAVDTATPPAVPSVSLRGYMANVSTGVCMLPQGAGNRCYHILGAKKAEIPMTQINTYLACGFYEKFMKAVKDDAPSVTREDVSDFAGGLRLTFDAVCEKLGPTSPEFILPDVDPRELVHHTSKPAPGKLNVEWALYGNEWRDNCRGRLTAKVNELSADIENYACDSINSKSLIGSAFCGLLDLAGDPRFGPYYAAQILQGGDYSLVSVIDDALRAAAEKNDALHRNLRDVSDTLERAKDEFYGSNALTRRRYYQNYKDAIGCYFENLYQIDLFTKTVEVLRALRFQLRKLYDEFFRPLVGMLEGLREAFEENLFYLNSAADGEEGDYTEQIFTLNDLRGRLDARIEEVASREALADFTRGLLKSPEEWICGDDERIAKQISEQMLALFEAEAGRSLEDYLFEKFPSAEGNAHILSSLVHTNLTEMLYRNAEPNFWSELFFDAQSVFESAVLTAPARDDTACQAMAECAMVHAGRCAQVRRVDLKDSLCCFRLYSGVSLRENRRVAYMKDAYDLVAQRPYDPVAAGLHLYSATRRGEGGFLDWRSYLIDPISHGENA